MTELQTRLQEQRASLITWNLESLKTELRSLNTRVTTMETKNESSSSPEIIFLSIFLQIKNQDKVFLTVFQVRCIPFR